MQLVEVCKKNIALIDYITKIDFYVFLSLMILRALLALCKEAPNFSPIKTPTFLYSESMPTDWPNQRDRFCWIGKHRRYWIVIGHEGQWALNTFCLFKLFSLEFFTGQKLLILVLPEYGEIWPICYSSCKGLGLKTFQLLHCIVSCSGRTEF